MSGAIVRMSIPPKGVKIPEQFAFDIGAPPENKSERDGDEVTVLI